MGNKIFEEIKFVPEKGGFFYNEVRYLLIRPETLAAFQKGAEAEIGEKASTILYQSGFHGGALSSKRYRDVFGLLNEEIIRFMMEMGSQIGWGRFELERFDAGKKILIVRVYHSPFAEGYGPSSKPVCNMIRGILGGMASSVFGKQVESKEISCLAKGDEYCRFEIMEVTSQ
jgi:predicted hydrocarbon binding protein